MAEQVPDVLGSPYLCETLDLPPDEEGPVVATLVSRRAPVPTGRAVLYVHGFADYFFQTEYAEWWTDRGYDFYAVDLRKYGRSLRPHQTAHYVTDLTDHFADLDAAWSAVTARDGHAHVVLSGHSTGGLVVSLWADARRPPELVGLVLNAPWLDLAGPLLRRTLGTWVIRVLGRVRPRALVRDRDESLYVRSIHRDLDGEWDFDLEWKPELSRPILAGWLAAVRRAHARLHRGLAIPCPVLVLSSDASGEPVAMGEEVFREDIVLDVDQIRQWSSHLGPRVTYVAVPGAMHDVVLSRQPARGRAYAELDRWRLVHLDPAPGTPLS